RNAQRFTYKIRPAQLTYRKDRLYQRYRKHFRGRLANTLRESLQDGSDKNIFNTQEICIYDGDQLVAFSFFDIGVHGMASIMGIYHPDYQSFSLGYYSMLLEIQFGLENNFHYYYPGYVVPGFERFEYKKRIGPVQYYNPVLQDWQLYHKDNPPFCPLEIIQKKLHFLELAMWQRGIPTKKCHYPLFEANLFGFWKANYLEHPIFLWCYPRHPEMDYLILSYDLVKQHYYLLKCSQFNDIPFYIKAWSENCELDSSKFTELLIVEEHIAKSQSAEEIINQLAKYTAR
ncbi:MAG: arginine-tRNA-protein transferase, partial [Saprospiraceae bacterium]